MNQAQNQNSLHSSEKRSVVSQARRSSKHSKTKLFLVVAAVGVFFAVAGSFAVYGYINSRPEKVLADALSNTITDTLEGRAAATSGSTLFELRGERPIKVKLALGTKTIGDNSEVVAYANVLYAAKTYKVKARGVAFGDGEYYFKLENLKKTIEDLSKAQPALGTYVAPANLAIVKLDNTWVKVTKADIQSLGGMSSFEKCSEAFKNLELSDVDQKQLKKLFKQNQFLVVQSSSTEVINGEKSFHYVLNLNDVVAKKFTDRVLALESFAPVKLACEAGVLTGPGAGQLKDNSGATNPVIDLWVGKKSRRLTKLHVAQADKAAAFDFSTQTTSSAQDIDIQKPKTFITVNELKTELEKITTKTE